MPARSYKLDCALPGIALGVLPSALGLLGGSPWTAVFGAFFLASAGGDMLILRIIRHVSARTVVKDHPSAAGCFVAMPGILHDEALSDG